MTDQVRITAVNYIRTDLWPTEAGFRFGLFLNSEPNLERVILDFRNCRPGVLISSFFSSMMAELYQLDPEKCEALSHADIEADHAFQADNIRRWLAPFQDAQQCITLGVRRLARPQSVQIGLPPAFDTPVLNVVSAEWKSYSVPISHEAAEVLIANGMSCEG